MTELSSKRVYEVWIQVVQDEELYEAMLEGTHGALAGRALDPEAIAILDWMHDQPGMRWNVENLRFRSACFVADVVMYYLPRTLTLLTGGNELWRQDLCFEYLAHHRWQQLGHMQLTECVRFAKFVRARVMRRRVTPAHLDAVLSYELAVVELLRSTAKIAPEAWPVRREVTELELPALRPRRSPAQIVIDLDVDLRPWIESGDPLRGEIRPEPITILVDMPSLAERYRIKTISDGVRVVLERCDGERSVAALTSELEDEFELPAADVRRTVRNLLDERILCA